MLTPRAPLTGVPVSIFATCASMVLAMLLRDTEPPSANVPAPPPAAVMFLILELAVAPRAMVLAVDITVALSI